MAKLSAHYRNDEAAGIDPAIKAYLDQHYLAELVNLDKTNPKLVVVFSGGNAVGKSTIAAKIADRFNGLVLENDAIKRCILQSLPNIDRDQLNQTTWQYSMELYARLGSLTDNGLVVRDGVIDWYYDRVLPVFEQAGYRLFIVGFDLSKAKALELIKTRGDTPTVKEERFYKIIQDHEVHQKRFREHYTPDVILTDETIFDQAIVLDALAQKLAELNNH